MIDQKNAEYNTPLLSGLQTLQDPLVKDNLMRMILKPIIKYMPCKLDLTRVCQFLSHFQKDTTRYKTYVKDRHGVGRLEIQVTQVAFTKALKFLVIEEKLKRTKNLAKDLENLLIVTIDKKRHKNGITSMRYKDENLPSLRDAFP